MRAIYIKYIEISLLRSFFQSKKQVERSGRTVKTIKRLIRRAYREILYISKPLIKLGGTTKEPIVLKNRKIGSIYVWYKKEEIKMQSKIDEIKKLAEEKISKIKNSQDLQELKVQFLGKKSELSNLLKGLGALTAEERPKVGALVNEARKEIEEKLSIAEEQIKSKMLEEKIKKSLDIEAQKVCAQLVHEYNKNKEKKVNKKFDDIVASRIDKSYLIFKNYITSSVIKSIPDGYFLDPSNTYIFLDQVKFFTMYEELTKKHNEEQDRKHAVLLESLKNNIAKNSDIVKAINKTLKGKNLSEEDIFELIGELESQKK